MIQMELYSENKCYKLYHGNMLDMLDVIDLNSIDSIVTDPPYELNFMGKGWDSAGVSFQKETWKKCFDVLKPGGYLLAFGGSRTFHRIACAIEDAGFEIRDTICWLYGSGFPKGINIANGIEGKLTIGSANKKDQKQLDGEKGIIQLGYNKNNAEDGWRPNNYNGQETTVKVNYTTDEAKRWEGWNTALKPSYEPIIVARKPFDGTLIDNILKYGVGGINIDECRVSTSDTLTHGGNLGASAGDTRTGKALGMFQDGTQNTFEQNPNGRYPANTILTYNEENFDEVCGGFPNTKSSGGSMTMPDLRDVGKKSKESIGIDKLSFGQVSNAERKETSYTAPSDEGSAARYFYNAQISGKDEEEIKQTNRKPRANVVFNGKTCGFKSENNHIATADPKGRYPANTILTYGEEDEEEVCGGFPHTVSSGGSGEASKANTFSNVYGGGWGHEVDCSHLGGLGDSGSAARYFYCAKASKKDRDEGLDNGVKSDDIFILIDDAPEEIKKSIKTLLNQQN